MASKSTKKPPTFEAGLEQLEQMAAKMEAPDLPLEELMKLYEDGMALVQTLSQKLDAMKATMQEVKSGKDGKPIASGLEAQTSIGDMLNAEDDR